MNSLPQVLHERVPGAPGKEAGLDATVAWVAATYPDIDLDSPPTYPASASTGGAWCTATLQVHHPQSPPPTHTPNLPALAALGLPSRRASFSTVPTIAPRSRTPG